MGANYPLKKLGDVADFVRGITFKPDDVIDIDTANSVACMRTKNVQSDLDLSDVWAVPASFVKRDEQYLRKGDILVSSANSWNLVGKCSWVPQLPYRATIGGFISCLRKTSQNLDERYLFHWFSSEPVQDLVRNCARKTTNISNLSFDQCLALEIPLPSLEEQKRIAAILDQADDIRRKRQHAIDRLNQLGQAIFYEMFGDPATNPRGWKTDELGELAAKFSDGPFGSNLKSEHYVDEGVRVIRLQNIGVSEFIDRDKAFISYRHFSKLAKHECISGDVIVGTMGDPNLRACILPDFVGTALNKADCVQIRPKNGVATSGYLCGLLNSPSTERMAHDLILGQTRARISMGRLKGLRVPVPPFAIQVAYDEKITMIQSIKEIQNRYLDDQFRALQSLQHRAFTGQL